MSERIQILLTNDDGIQSPGLWAAAQALSALGYVTIAAPRDQASSTGRSMPLSSDGRISQTTLRIGDQDWPAYSVGGTPAQTVLHAVYEIMPRRPDLVVSGINYGENIGTGITVSGTVGAAMEGAALGIPSMAVSLQLQGVDYYSYNPHDFSTAAYFTALIARRMLENPLPPDVDLLKVEVPYKATPETPWAITRLARHRYFFPVCERPGTWDDPYYIEGRPKVAPGETPPGTDVDTLVFAQQVSVTPLSLDMTSRVDLRDLERSLKA